MKSKLTEKGQVTIPKPLRESLGLEPGQELEFEEQAGTVVVRRKITSDGLRQLVGLVTERVDVDACLAETRGPAWRSEQDGAREE